MLLVLVALIWDGRYYFICHYKLWRLDHTTHGSEIEDIISDIREIGQYVEPLLEKTYNDTKQSRKRRSAVAWAMIKVDKVKAERLFQPYLLKGNDDDVIAQAIYDLGRNGSKNEYSAVLNFLKYPNENVRLAVVFFLGEIYMPKSVSLLQQIRETDPSEKIRESATYRLQLYGILPSPMPENKD